MRSGGLRHRFVIERNVGATSHAMGGRSELWELVKQVRARAAFKGGKEFERARQTTADITTLFVIRFDKSLDTRAMHAMRLRSLDDGAIYRINYAADPDHRQRQIHIHASEAQSA